jgi:hypothetical protein
MSAFSLDARGLCECLIVAADTQKFEPERPMTKKTDDLRRETAQDLQCLGEISAPAILVSLGTSPRSRRARQLPPGSRGLPSHAPIQQILRGRVTPQVVVFSEITGPLQIFARCGHRGPVLAPQ